MSANRKAFEFLVVAILDHLFEHFPEQLQISGGDFCARAVMASNREVEVIEKVPAVFDDTVAWLEAEGFIRVSQHERYLAGDMPGEVLGSTLTIKGLTLVGYTFDPAAGDRSTLAETAKEIIKTGASDAASAWIKRLLNTALDLGMNIAGN